MLVFIDDSGDPGFSSSSTLHFVISCVIFDDELEAESTALVLKRLRRELKFPDSVEFKFYKSSNKVKTAFLQSVKKCNFRVRAIVMTKSALTSQELRNSKDSFYNYAIKSVIKYSHGRITNAKIRLDGHGDRTFKRNLISYLRKQLNSPKNKVIKDIKLVDSRSNILIQLADMISGAIRRSYDPSVTNAQVYRKIIKNKLEDVWEFN